MKPLTLQDAILVLRPTVTSSDIIAVSCIWRAPSTTDLISCRLALCLRLLYPALRSRGESDRCEAGIARSVPTHSDGRVPGRDNTRRAEGTVANARMRAKTKLHRTLWLVGDKSRACKQTDKRHCNRVGLAVLICHRPALSGSRARETESAYGPRFGEPIL